MTRVILSLFLLFAVQEISTGQEIKKINSVKQLDSIKDVSKGKVMLVNFWATWCKPCVQEFPDLLKLYSNYTGKGLTLIFISLDFPEELETKVRPFLKINGVDFTVYFNDFKKQEELMDYFDKSWDGAIPSTYIFDKNGELRIKFIGSRNYEFFENEIIKYID